ncbi:hypothetical protein C8034_v009452 [Colletotrichum sidae]|uniref:Uncharacterized protein n=1 Tax=Colletotrichum sidae TaxID=1347389 RepID=A0A4R8TL48_9PEZI|nr:hypothetical protein C8034_v009452 [Colletotrichum sidae]
MKPITIFEDPWPEKKEEIPLESAAIAHVDLVGIFLKLVPLFSQDEDEEFNMQALAWSEWRYIAYIRFLDVYGVSPHDCPPPWDVAIIWYCHLLSPYHFHRHLWDNRHISYGMNHHHFPVSKMLDLYKSGKWTHKKTKKMWDRWNRKLPRTLVPKTPFVLWDSPPPQEEKRRSSIFTSLLPTKKSTDWKREQPERIVNCYSTWCQISGKTQWDIEDYTDFRAGVRSESCLRYNDHKLRGGQCELMPWPTLHDLKDVLGRQVAFWKAALRARDSDPEFLSKENLDKARGDYERFIKLPGKPPKMKGAGAKVRVDMDALPARGVVEPRPRNREFVPLTLAIDLFWHTHRLYPANYWVWSFATAGRLIDYEHTSSAVGARLILEETRREWKSRNGVQHPTKYAMDEPGMEAYIPDAAVVPPGHPARAKAMWVLGGMNPVRERKRYSKGYYMVFDGVFVPFDGGGGGGDGGGGGGGDGGGCGGDGGGGGGGGGGE